MILPPLSSKTIPNFGVSIIASIALFVTLIAMSSIVRSEINNYPFDYAVEEKRFTSLLGELRCPKCQNQSLADSDAEIAKDLRQRVYDLLQDNKSDQEIRNYLIERYGDFVSYRPPLNISTSVLWFGPFILLLVSVAIAVRIVKSAKQSTVLTSPVTESITVVSEDHGSDMENRNHSNEAQGVQTNQGKKNV